MSAESGIRVSNGSEKAEGMVSGLQPTTNTNGFKCSFKE